MSQIRYVLIQYLQCGGHKRVEVLVSETDRMGCRECRSVPDFRDDGQVRESWATAGRDGHPGLRRYDRMHKKLDTKA
jgi:hypothetical protein